jgi:hypothetical protein
MTADELAFEIKKEAADELVNAVGRIKHCVDQLRDDWIWAKPHPALNSIGNLILHLEGNLTQWIVCGIGGAEDHRNRPAEFAEQPAIPRADLLRRLEIAVASASLAFERQDADALARVRRIQGFEVTGVGAIFSSIPHFRGHTQEIIHMTRAILGAGYQMQWKPATVEEGAPR